jgi:N-methylhydantoinase A/oxoprolinase/acetone carboxylase beta subunit
MNYRLGIDVGGTNTDAVILDAQDTVIASCKADTSDPVIDGIRNAVAQVLSLARIDPKDIHDAMLGTTHATNAVVQRKGLSRVGLIRLSAPSGFSIPPYIEWPQDILTVLEARYHIVKGGYEYNGTPIAAANRDEISRALDNIAEAEMEALAVSGVFSLVNAEQELLVAELAKERVGKEFPVTLSHEIGAIGLIERENAAILNASIRKLAENAYGSFEDVLKQNDIDAELFITQNDGTLMGIEYAKHYPVLTIASGPTNSLRGAAYLSGERDAVVIDVGGTTTDLGVLKNGFPRESGSAVEIGGIRTNFRMPDLVSIGLGGGSVVKEEGEELYIGPESVGYRIRSEALCFGGKTLTATDVAVAAGTANIGNPEKVTGITRELQERVRDKIRLMVEELVDKMKTVAGDVPVVAVGGASILIPERIGGASRVIKPEHYEVANAIGAAIAQVSGQVDGIFDVAGKGRDAVLEEVKESAIENARKAGAKEETIEIMEIDEIPLTYLPSNAVRFRAKAVGDLKK